MSSGQRERQMTEPTQHFFESQRLRLSYWDWGNAGAPPLVLIHGGRDHARSWDRVAEALRADYHVVALDMRGHGDSAWAVGSQYGLPDVALDIARMIEVVGAPAHVVAHSYGAQCTLIAAGTFPDLFASLIPIEGTNSHNPRSHPEGMGPGWLRDWADRARDFETPRLRVYRTIEEAAARMREENPRLPLDELPTLASYAVRPVDGGFVWKFDGWVLNRTSMEIRREELPRFWGAITCPMLLVSGSESHLSLARNSEVVTLFKQARSIRGITVPGAGHWVHHDNFPVFVGEVRTFLDEVQAPGRARAGR
jgi:pimeloyl-ACP methyl ester carboxylesterase